MSDDQTLNVDYENLLGDQSYVRIEADHMTAWLYLVPPEDGRNEYTKAEITALLVREGVTYGYHTSNLSAVVKKGIYNREIKIAQGRMPENGKDGYYQYDFEFNGVKTPVIREDGTADYTGRAYINNVRAGDRVAVYHHATAGLDGADVLGNVLKAAAAKELPPLRGTGINNIGDPDIYVAAKEGKIEMRDGKLSIQSIHEISGDVDQLTGRIDFFGDVLINGNVESGVTIRAGRNVEIRGSVEAATIFAGGDIMLRRGIQGQHRAQISARGNIVAGFIEQTVVTAGGNVYVDCILNSRVMSEGMVTVTGKRGCLVGGYIHALQGIKATVVGNDAEVKTVVHAGAEAEVCYRRVSLRKAQNILNEKLAGIVEEAKDWKVKAANVGGMSNPVVEKAVRKLLEQKAEIDTLLQENRRELAEANDLLIKGKEAVIRVDGNIFRGTVICLMQHQMPIETNTSFMSYAIEGNMIAGTVIIH